MTHYALHVGAGFTWLIIGFVALYFNEMEVFYTSVIISSIWFATIQEQK